MRAPGTYGGARQPSQFLCLILKMLQIQPDREVILEYILQDSYKYLRILGAHLIHLSLYKRLYFCFSLNSINLLSTPCSPARHACSHWHCRQLHAACAQGCPIRVVSYGSIL